MAGKRGHLRGRGAGQGRLDEYGRDHDDRRGEQGGGELALTIGLTGSLILWHRPSNRIGMLLALTGVLFAVSVLAGGYSRTRARAVACRRGYASRRSQVPG
jgi:hypothetical protein